LNLLVLNIFTSIPELITKAVEANPLIAYFVIGFSMFIENLIPPIPSEIIMPLGGYFVFQGSLNFYILIFFGLTGTVLGSLPWYYLGKLLNENKISNFLDDKGRFMGLSSKDLKKSRSWFDKYGVSLVFWGRLIPGVRTLISIPAGVELMPLGKFLTWTSLGSLIWVVFLTIAGYVLGENYEKMAVYLDNFKIFLKPILIFLLVVLFYKIFKNLKN